MATLRSAQYILLLVLCTFLPDNSFVQSYHPSAALVAGDRRHLPSPPKTPIIIGYAHDAKSGKAERAIRDGASVIIWSFLHLEQLQNEDAEGADEDSASESPRGKIRTELDLEEIKNIRVKHDHVIHLAAFGGWNGPHPPNILTGKEWCNVFMQFNKSHGYLFDGVDWDYEGHDDLTAPTAKFTLETLDIMADFSVEAKRQGLIVSMAPAESYLDASITPGSVDGKFSLDLDLPPRAWTSDRYHASEEDRKLVESKGFQHAGRQCYAYVLAKAGMDTFDWISIQLYEAYSPFAHDVHRRKLGQSEALMIRIQRIVDGYTVTDLPFESSEYEVKIPPAKLVIGVANKWADGMKFCRVEPSALRSAYETTLAEYDEGFLGVMFWTIEEEGDDDASRLTHLLARQFQQTGGFNEL